jgi:hypothetical protein
MADFWLQRPPCMWIRLFGPTSSCLSDRGATFRNVAQVLWTLDFERHVIARSTTGFWHIFDQHRTQKVTMGMGSAKRRSVAAVVRSSAAMENQERGIFGDHVG